MGEALNGSGVSVKLCVLWPAGAVVPAGRVFLFFWQRGHETCVAAACHSHGSRQWGGSPLTLTLSDPLRQPAPCLGQARCRFRSCYCLLLSRSLMPLICLVSSPWAPSRDFPLTRAKRGPDTLSGAWGREVSTWSLAAACHGLEPQRTSCSGVPILCARGVIHTARVLEHLACPPAAHWPCGG